MTQQDQPREEGGIPESPIHILSAISTGVLDMLWSSLEGGAALSVVGLGALLPLALTLGVINFIVTTLVQHFLGKESWSEAATKGLVLGIAAGVPFPVVGTLVGGGGAIWSVASMLSNARRSALPAPKTKTSTTTTPPDHQLSKPTAAETTPKAPVPPPPTQPAAPDDEGLEIEEGEIVDEGD